MQKKKNVIVLLSLLTLTVALSMINFNTLDAKAETPFTPPPNPPTMDLNGDLIRVIGWVLTLYLYKMAWNFPTDYTTTSQGYIIIITIITLT